MFSLKVHEKLETLVILSKTFSPISIKLPQPRLYPHPYDQSYPGLGFSITSSAPLLNCSHIIYAGSFGHCLTLLSFGLLSISPTGLLTPRSYGPFLLLPCLAIMSSRAWPRYPEPTVYVLLSNSCFSSAVHLLTLSTHIPFP